MESHQALQRRRWTNSSNYPTSTNLRSVTALLSIQSVQCSESDGSRRLTEWHRR
jgi:hypothetical protein